MTQCPKCRYIRQSIDAQIHPDICPACGIVYKKWLAQHSDKPVESNAGDTAPEIIIYDKSEQRNWKNFVFYVPENIDPTSFWPRVLTLIGFALWGFYFISAGVDWEKIGSSFLHNVNLPFHEFGHIFFAPFGRFMMILGGSLFQVIMPLGLMCVFVFQKRDNFSASIMLWWCGQNFIDVSPYIDDAQHRALPLVGGGGEESHDWGNLLTMMNMLPQTHKISHASFLIGTAIILTALAWGIYILMLQKKNVINRL